MLRREFIGLVGGAAVAWPLVARAQQTGKIPKVGFLYPGPVASAPARVAVILEGLHTVGYREPGQIEVVSRVADGNPARLVPLAAELIEQKVDVVIAVSTTAVRGVQAAAATIPIIAFDLETDPVAAGLIESYVHPGGKITGVFFDFPEFRTKWLELLREAIPNLSSIAMLWDPVTGDAQPKLVETAADKLHLNVKRLEVRALSELDDSFLAAKRQRVDAVLALSSPLFGPTPNLRLLADLALRHKLPAVTLFPDFARVGGLIAYGPNLLDTYRPVGVLLGKILQGTKPADLPVERPSKFELVVNVKTANAIGITIPTSILLRADEVID
jgi:putative ABC transport system substrate-binding protein